MSAKKNTEIQSPEPCSVAPARERCVSDRVLGASRDEPSSLPYCGKKDDILDCAVEEATNIGGEKTFAEKPSVQMVTEVYYYPRIVLILTSMLFLAL